MEDGNSIDEIERRTDLVEAQVLCVMCAYLSVKYIQKQCKLMLLRLFAKPI